MIYDLNKKFEYENVFYLEKFYTILKILKNESFWKKEIQKSFMENYNV